MGFCSEKKPKKYNNEYAPEVPPSDEPTNNIHLLIVTLDYNRTSFSLTCSLDGCNMQTLANACGITSIHVLKDEQCTRDAVIAKIAEVAGRCEPDDYFIFFYAGHGDTMKDQDGDEDDGLDEAMVLVDPNGQFKKPDTYLRDDDFADIITANINEEARVLILMDCCHSGTIADLDKDCWNDIAAVCISGCLDSEESGDMGKGGIFTHALLLAIDNLQQDNDEYSVTKAYNMTLKYDEDIFHSAQTITLHMTQKATANGMSWPLVPAIMYEAPLRRARRRTRGVDGVAPPSQAELEQLGIRPHSIMTDVANGDQNLDIDPDTLPKQRQHHRCCVQ